MTLRFCSLGSGSRGNGTLVSAGDTRILIDCGFFLREAELRLRRFGVEPETLSAILVTHEHFDHIGGVSRLARKYEIPVYLSTGTHAGWDDPYVPALTKINPQDAFVIGDIEVQPFPVPHDAREPTHFVFSAGGRRLGVVSDAGSVTPQMRDRLSGCDALMLEFNYDPDMLRTGPYPAKLQRRVGGEFGHLSNGQAAELLTQIDRSRLQHLVLTHLSEKNNTPGLALAAAAQALEDAPPWMVCAHQARGLEWREIV